MMSYEAARDALAGHLLNDAAAHERERYDEIGRRFDSLEHAFPTAIDGPVLELRIVLTFWDAWIDARNNGWPTTAGIRQHEWPALARRVAADLTAGGTITDARVRSRFDADAHHSLGDRVHAIAARLRERSASH
jgi:hypothetical protein